MNTELFAHRTVLIVDDEELVLMSLKGILRSGGLTNIICLQDSRELLDLCDEQDIGVILLDLTMPYLSGEELLPLIHLDYPDIPVIIITGDDELSTAVECMKMGAYDYLVKPIEFNKLIATVRQAFEVQELRNENAILKRHLIFNEFEHPEAFSEIVTINGKFKSILLYIEAIACTPKCVLITGETGVGKELIARAIHTLGGCRGELVSVNVAGFDDNMFADTLFGHKKGAFTGADQDRKGLIEAAVNGTLFLDEIGDLSQTSQVKLLRLLETNEYLPLGLDAFKRSEARIIAATNKNLVEALEAGTFRRDLYYRLQTHHIHVPPLRERLDDIPILVEHFLQDAAQELGIKKPAAPAELFILLENYQFPGNIRELKSMIYDALSRSKYNGMRKAGGKKHKAGILSLDSFKEVIGKDSPPFENESGSENLIAFSQKLPTIKQATKLLVDEAMKRAKGRQTIAAQLLGVSQQALSKRLTSGKLFKGSNN